MSANFRTIRVVAAVLCSTVLLVSSASLAQQRPPDQVVRPETVPDEMQTLVVGTRFVPLPASGASAKDRFMAERIAITAFNETDQCIDQGALELAQDYFNSLGRVLSKAGHYYFIPNAGIAQTVSACIKTHGKPPATWSEANTEIIAYGKRVPTAEAAALELSLR